MTPFARRTLVTKSRDEDYQPLTSKGLMGQPDEGKACYLISRELTGSDDLMVGLGRLLPGEYHLKHHHPGAAEFYLIIKGTSVFHIAGDEVRGDYGTAIYIPRNAIHAIRNDTNAVCEFVWGFDRPTFDDCGMVYDE